MRSPNVQVFDPSVAQNTVAKIRLHLTLQNYVVIVFYKKRIFELDYMLNEMILELT